MLGLLVLATVAFMVIFACYDQYVLRSDLGVPPLPKFRAFIKIVGKAIKTALCIVVGVPLTIALIALCFVWPPLLVLPLIGFGLWAMCSGGSHPTNYAPAPGGDLLTGIVVGVAISESLHHHHHHH